jgi:CRP-like cAMP-binding protein
VDAILQSKVEAFFEPYTLVRHDKGTVLAMPGEEPPGVMYLLEGRVGQLTINADGSKFILNQFKPPAFFPMSWALNRAPNEHLFEVLEPIRARRAPAGDVVEFLRANPDVALNLLARVYRGTDGVLRRLAQLLGGSASSRLLSELTIEARRFGRPEGAGGFVVHLTHDDLAARTGLARETVTRELHKLKTKRLISTTARTITIPDLRSLELLLSAA